MEVFFFISLFIFWTLFWSFGSVIIYRLKSWEKGILNGRSHCGKCNHILNSLDLIPIFSWLKNWWKCNYCKDKISSIYPFLEISMGALFALVWYFLIDSNLIYIWDANEIIRLLFWLFIAFITIIYTFYDLLFLEIHEWVLLSWVWVASLAIILQSYWIISIIPTLPPSVEWNLLSLNHSVWLLIVSLIWLYFIMIKWLSEIWDFVILIAIWVWIYAFNIFFATNIPLNDFPAINALFWAFWLFIFFFLQIVVSKWAWLGWWDLRIAILVWLLLWVTLTAPWAFATYLAWSIIWIGYIAVSKIKNKWKKIDTQIPFWPFLAIWFFITIFFQNEILELLKIYF